MASIRRASTQTEPVRSCCVQIAKAKDDFPFSIDIRMVTLHEAAMSAWCEFKIQRMYCADAESVSVAELPRVVLDLQSMSRWHCARSLLRQPLPTMSRRKGSRTTSIAEVVPGAPHVGLSARPMGYRSALDDGYTPGTCRSQRPAGWQ